MGLALAFASALSAQAPDRGLLGGTVLAEGRPVPAALVHAVDRQSGVERTVRTSPDGRFAFAPLLQATYDVTVEKLGYRPAVVAAVPVLGDRTASLTITLEPTAPPVTSVDSSRLAGGGWLPRPGGVRRFAELELEHAPHPERSVADLARLSTEAAPDGAFQGLPERMTGIAVDGFLQREAGHPDFQFEAEPRSLLPLLFLEGAELIRAPVSGDWEGVHGPVLHGLSARGTAEATARATVLFGGYESTTEPLLGGDDAGRDDIQGGGVARGAVIADTVFYGVGAWARSSKRPIRPAFTDTALAEAVAAIGTASGQELAGYGTGAVLSEVAGSAFGRLDWQLGSRNQLSVLALADLLRQEPDTGPERRGLHTLERQNVLAGAALGSTLSARFYNEFRVGVSASGSDYTAPTGPEAGVPTTWLADAGAELGADPRLPGLFDQVTVDIDQSLQFHASGHRLELGAELSFASRSQTYGFAREGVFAFGTPDDMAAGTGAFWQTTGSLPVADYSTARYGLLLRDRWTPTSGLNLVFGIRRTSESLPRDQVRRDAAWADLTGIDNTAFDDRRTYYSPHLGFVWNLRDRYEWVVHGGAASTQGSTEPWVVSEILANDGTVDVRRGFGALGTWPGTPDGATAPVVGTGLTILGQDFEAPRTTRFALGVTRALGSSGALRIEGVYRETANLPVRSDINLPGAVATDQYGRPIYGVLEKAGSLVGATPGSNRRFPGYDAVYLLSSTGSSTYVGGTVALEKRAGDHLEFYAGYTLSDSEDDAPALAGSIWGPGEGLSPFADASEISGWETAPSAWNAPHRLSLAARVRANGRLAPALTLLYRFSSGAPFTPGFPTGVDVNGDGAVTNDPAYIDEAIAGMDEVLVEWECLRSQIGTFAGRNSCETDATHGLALRGSVALSGGGVQGGLFVEALGLMDDRTAPVDRALYAIDPGAPLIRDAGTGTVTLPLLVNPGFGQPLTDFTIGPELRIGLFLRY